MIISDAISQEYDIRGFAEKNLAVDTETNIANSPKQFCFVVMPFGGIFDELYWRIIKPTIMAAGFDPERINESQFSCTIPEAIKTNIRKAKVIVVELTGLNPNVMFEFGFSVACGKEPIILKREDDQELPFDICTYRVIFYKDNAVGGIQLRENLLKAISGINNRNMQTASLGMGNN